jgi:hypothetical protein
MKRVIHGALVLIALLFINTNVYSVDVILKSHAEVQNFISTTTGRIAVDILDVSGNDVNQQDINGLEGKISAINNEMRFHDLTFVTVDAENKAVTSLESFIINVAQNGGIVLTDLPYLDWIGQGKVPRVVNGNFIIRNCPNIPTPGRDGWATNTSFGDIEEVKGDFVVGSWGNLQNRGDNQWFEELKRVGGSFRVLLVGPGADEFWNFGAPKLTYIGGDFEYRGNDNNGVNDLRIIQNVTHIGGDVTIVNFPKFNLTGGGDDGLPSFCFIRYLIDTEVIDYACHNVILGYEDEPVDLASLGACTFSNPVEVDNPPASLPAKDPDCATGIKALIAQEFASIYPTLVKDYLVVDSKSVLSKVEIIDLIGKSALSFFNLPAKETYLPVAQLSKGIYVVKLTGLNGQVQNFKIIK